MKTRKIVPLVLVLLLLLESCTASTISNPTDAAVWSAEALAEAVLSSVGLSPDALEQLEDADQSFYLTELYGLPEGAWEDCALYRAGGASAVEVAVIVLEEEADAQAALDGLKGYLTAREGDFTGYAPEQADLVAHAAAVREGRYLALLICEDPEVAQTAFLQCLDGQAAPVPTPSMAPSPVATAQPVSPPGTPVTYPGRYDYRQPNLDDMTLYDTSAILSAWDSGDASALSKLDRAILDRATQVLNAILSPGMTSYEKERAVYQWLTDNVVYDHDHYNPLVELDPNSFNPYGPLRNGKGVCLGFATTFQLLMDLSGVECITVVGAAFQSQEDHAWNMVRLNDTWYCVDATWDAGDAPDTWRYFNVTSDKMSKTNHQWDYNQIPEATATDGGLPA